MLNLTEIQQINIPSEYNYGVIADNHQILTRTHRRGPAFPMFTNHHSTRTYRKRSQKQHNSNVKTLLENKSRL